ncbi:EAL domain-containing protein [Metabacillus sp. HB246100]|uniref:EAL domain-containing protein n=1 Tax=Bacillus weihaiensis TaxID=1547283 RepID=UPI0023531AAB|nr:EAL domain-containing protein [Bacillus weihaiensis]
MDHCKSCFQPLTIHNSGYFSILLNEHTKLEEVLTKLYFQKKENICFTKQYHDKSELKELLSFIRCELGDLSSYKGAISVERNETNTEFLSLHTIYEHTFHEKTVNLIKYGQFESYLQPILNVATGEIYGYEALLRAKDQSIFPSQLFEVARKTEMHSMLDKKAREVALYAKSKKIPKGVKVFINFLPSTIYNPNHCLKHTFELVEKFNIDPRDLVFEVVETEKIENISHLKSIFQTYRSHGMKVALDDVGAGYSTLDMLTKLRPDYIKVDRQYITDCHLNKESQTFLQGVITLAKELHITVLAEGIEQEQEYEYLKNQGISLAQGYYIGKPSPTPLLSYKVATSF